jgi:6,7-dimethyl-8-ribityllumazine synthase
MSVYQGTQTAPPGRFAIVASRIKSINVEKLVDGAIQAHRHNGVAADAVDIAWVPGSFEVPLVAQRLAASGRYAAIIALGAVIRGETDHYDFIAAESARGVAQAALSTGVPVTFGILTCATIDQALDRAGGKSGNKGADAAVAAIQMANLMSQLPEAH